MRHATTKETKVHRRLSSRAVGAQRHRIRTVPFPNAMTLPNPAWLPEPIDDWDSDAVKLDTYGIFVREDD